MHMTKPSRGLNTPENDRLKLILRVAKSLHRAARSDSRPHSLPVLRRLIASETFRHISLPELYRQRMTIQRKHILHMLALEAGHLNWLDYKKKVETHPEAQPLDYNLALKHAGYPNIWFTSLPEAERYAAAQGGQPIAVGKQAVVIPFQEQAC